MRYKRSGFTIVELLIVIVVIAILAAISVVAYNGIQDRANSARVETVIKAYKAALEMYYLDNGKYPHNGPNPNSSPSMCLGEASNYPAVDGFGIGECFRKENVTWRYSISTWFNSEMEKYLASVPDASFPTLKRANNLGTMEWYRGARISSWPQKYTITYYIKGNQSCPTGQRATAEDYSSGEEITFCMVWRDKTS